MVVLNYSALIKRVSQDDQLVHDQLSNINIKSTDYRLYHFLLKLSSEVYRKNDLTYLTDSGEPIISNSQEELSNISGLSVSTVKRSLSRLESVGLIKVIHRKGYGKIGNQVVVLGDFYDYVSDDQYEKWVKEHQDKQEKHKRCFDMKIEIDKLHKRGLMTKQERKIVEVSEHYNMLAREMIGRGGYYSLSKKNPWDHKNWSRFEKLVRICKENNWNPNQYLDCQFDRARKYWTKSKLKFPLPHMLCSQNAIKYFTDWRQEQDEFQEDNPKYNRNKSRKTYKSLYKQVIHDVMQAAERVDEHMRMYYEGRGFQHYQLVYHKMKYVVENYWLFPASYLYSYKFIRDDPERLIHFTTDYKYGYTQKIQQDIKTQFPLYRSSKKLSEACIKSRKTIEKDSGYFVRGSFNVMDTGASERFYKHSLLKLGYSEEEINRDIEKSHQLEKEQQEILASGGHLSNIKTMGVEEDKELYSEDDELEVIEDSLRRDKEIQAKREKRMADFKKRGLTNTEIIVENMVDSKRREAYCEDRSFNEDEVRAHWLEVLKPWIDEEKAKQKQ